jgi:hypothetical protein
MTIDIDYAALNTATNGSSTNEWQQFTADVPSDATTLTFSVDASFNTNKEVMWFDNLTITGTAVPEPTTTALLGLGGLALILRRRK